MRIATCLCVLLLGCTDDRGVTGGSPAAELVVPARATVGVPLQIDARGSRDPEGKLLRFRYDLGDGTPQVVTGAPMTHHIYRRAGRFQVCVWVADPDGLSAMACRELTVSPPADLGSPDAGVDAANDGSPSDRTASDGRLDGSPDGPKADATKPDTVKLDVSKPDAPKPDAPKPDAPKPDQSKPDLKADLPSPDLGGCFSPEVGGTGSAGYTLKLVPPCHPTLPATASKLGVNKDEAGAVTILPFAFSFFGKSSVAAGVSSNGYLQLVGPSPLSLLQPAPAAIPSAASPNNLVAVFWDNLAPLTSASDVSVAVLGQAPKRVYVIQWQGWRFSGTASPASLTFSVFLYEGSNVVELQYATLVGGARASGSQAAIGIENEDGSLGLQHAFKQAGAVSTAQGIRFVPK